MNDVFIPSVTILTAARSGAFVLVAPPGAGKTTGVPPLLLDEVAGQVWVLEPRRVAARAAARRIAEQRGGRLGGEVGVQVRFDRVGTDPTRLWVVTEGILLRRLQADPFLEGVAEVLVDEFHERSLLADLSLALLAEVRREARPDLIVGVMSATMDPEPVAAFLGGAPIVRVEGRTYPIAVEHREEPLADAVRRVLGEGDVLCFLPGVREIREAAAALDGIDADVVPLYGALPGDQQDAALRPGPRRRVVLATNVAETSVTVPGVRTVVDTGLARQPRFDPASGLDRLELVRISRASADQRAGRAGRTGPGRCVRLWSERVHRGLAAHDLPEVHRVDLSGPCLQLKAWGTDPRAFGWVERPRDHALDAAERLLEDLGAIEAGAVTPLGQRLAELPVAPRIGRMLVEGQTLGQAGAVSRVAAELSERGPAAHLDGVARQLERLRGPGPAASVDEDEAVQRAILAGWPDRVARRRGGSARARMVGGRGGRLDQGSLVTSELFVCVDVDDVGTDALVRRASPVDEAWLHVEAVDALSFDEASGAVRARRVRRYRDLELHSQPIEADPVAAARVLEVAAASRLDRATPDDRDWAQLVARLALATEALGWPALDPAELLPLLCAGRRSLGELRAADWAGAVRDHLGWARWQQLEREVPERIEVPSGSAIRVTYEVGRRPVLAVRMQELFGSRRTPTVAGAPVLLHLLAPNGRPQQITDDLGGFWERTWPEVRKELRARYPKHAWPEDPASAPPERRPQRKR